MYGTGAHLGQGCKVSDGRAVAGTHDAGGKRPAIVSDQHWWLSFLQTTGVRQGTPGRGGPAARRRSRKRRGAHPALVGREGGLLDLR